MAKTKKLFHLYLPLTDNDGTPFPETLFTEVATELSTQFGGSTRARPVKEAALLGEWVEPSTREMYQDEVIAYYVRFAHRRLRLTALADVSLETEAFFIQLKQSLLEQFRQKDIFLVAYLVEVY